MWQFCWVCVCEAGKTGQASKHAKQRSVYSKHWLSHPAEQAQHAVG